LTDRRLEVVRALLGAYVRGERSDAEIRDEVRADPVLAPVARSCLGCSGLAQELIEALGGSPFDDPPAGERFAPTRAGVLRWLERVKDGVEEPGALCDWATDALAWHDPGGPVDPLVQDVLADLAGSEDDVDALVADAGRLELVVAHLERTPPDRAARAIAGLALHRRRDEVVIEVVRRASGEIDDDAFVAAVRRLLGDVAAVPDEVVAELAGAARKLAAKGPDVDRAERIVDRLARGDDGPPGRH